MSLEVHIRDSNFVRQGIIDKNSILAAGCSLNFNDVGNWILEVDRDVSSIASQLALGYGVIFVDTDTNQSVLSGPIRKIEERYDGNTTILGLSGSDDNRVLQRALALPCIGANGNSFPSAAYDQRSGVASTVMNGFVNANLIAGSYGADRVISGLSLAADPLVGSSVSSLRARFDNLLSLLQVTALAGGDIGFKVVQVGSGIVFTPYQPTDRSSTVVFSRDQGNLAGYIYSKSEPMQNFIYCGGGGVGTARSFRYWGDSASIVANGRIESFHDRRDTTVSADLDSQITADLAAGKSDLAVDVTTIDSTNCAYLTHWNLGDIVSYKCGNRATASSTIRQLNIAWSRAQGRIVSPVIGTPGATSSNVPAYLQPNVDLATRLSSLEAQ